MQHPEETELVDPSAVSSGFLAQRSRAVAVAENHACRLHFAELAELLKQKSFCIVERTVADSRLPPRLCSMQHPKVSENETWFSELARRHKPLSQCPLFGQGLCRKPEWTFIRNRRQCSDFKDQKFGMDRYSSTNSGVGETLKRDPMQCAASWREAILDSLPGHSMACL